MNVPERGLYSGCCRFKSKKLFMRGVFYNYKLLSIGILLILWPSELEAMLLLYLSQDWCLLVADYNFHIPFLQLSYLVLQNSPPNKLKREATQKGIFALSQEPCEVLYLSYSPFFLVLTLLHWTIIHPFMYGIVLTESKATCKTFSSCFTMVLTQFC